MTVADLLASLPSDLPPPTIAADGAVHWRFGAHRLVAVTEASDGRWLCHWRDGTDSGAMVVSAVARVVGVVRDLAPR